VITPEYGNAYPNTQGFSQGPTPYNINKEFTANQNQQKQSQSENGPSPVFPGDSNFEFEQQLKDLKM